MSVLALPSDPAFLSAAETGGHARAADQPLPIGAARGSVERLGTLIGLSLQNQALKRPGLYVAAIASGFRLLSRADSDPGQMIDVKFQMQLWRHQTKKSLLASMAAGLAPDDYLRALAELDALHIYVRPDEYRSIAAHFPAASSDAAFRPRAQAALALLIANQGNPLFPVGIAPAADLPRALRRKGPSTTSTRGIADIDGRDNAWAFARWSKDPEFSNYEYTDDGGLNFRGVHFLPGDIVLVDSLGLSAGTYTSMGVPQANMAHVTFFVILTSNGNRYPAIIDTGGMGTTRAIPLNVYLRPTQAAYVEVFRLRHRPTGFSDSLDRESRRFMQEEHHFDLSFGNSWVPRAQGSEDTYCPITYSLIIERLGLPPIEPLTRVKPRLKANLAKFGLSFDKSSRFVSTSDYSRGPRFEFVEAIDNDQFQRSIIRSLVVEHLMKTLEEGEVQLDKLPARFHICLSIVREIQSHSGLGYLYQKVAGYSERDFPVGDARTIALANYLDELMSKAAKSALRSLKSYHFRNDVPYGDLRRDPLIQSALDEAMSPTRAWLTAPGTE